MKYLYLDDWRKPNQSFYDTGNPIYLSDWDVVKNYNQFIDYITINGIPDTISFDHDIDDSHYGKTNLKEIYDLLKEKTGYHCALWLINYCIDNNLKLPNTVLIHSMSVEGAKNIKSLFETYYKVNNITDYNKINDVDFNFALGKFVYTYYQ
jgi:uncharacterized protein (UPF0297 family)